MPGTADETAERPICPDGGTCHHECEDMAVCWRVRNAGPLSGVYPNDEWPDAGNETAERLETVRTKLGWIAQWDMLSLTPDGRGAATTDAPWVRRLLRDMMIDTDAVIAKHERLTAQLAEVEAKLAKVTAERNESRKVAATWSARFKTVEAARYAAETAARLYQADLIERTAERDAWKDRYDAATW